MARRTIVNLSREMKVSRPTIYRAIDRMGIEKKPATEYSLGEWEAIKRELMSASGVNREKRSDAKKVERATVEASETRQKLDGPTIAGIAVSTLQERLGRAKQEYDYNRLMISIFQEEISVYVAEKGRTTMMSHNGSLTAIPAIANLEKYVKLNIALSKLITELEGDLDLSVEGGDDPFA